MFTKPLLGWQNYTKILYATIENWNLILECTYTEDNILSKSLCKICKIKPPYLNFQWLIGPSSIYVAKQQRTKWNHQKKKFLTFQWLCLILYLYKQFLRLGQTLPLSYSLLCVNTVDINKNIIYIFNYSQTCINRSPLKGQRSHGEYLYL